MTLSVRARLTLAVGSIALIAFALIAAIAPGRVRSTLDADLLDAEAQASYDFLVFDVGAPFEGEIFTLDEFPLDELPLDELPLDEFPLDEFPLDELALDGLDEVFERLPSFEGFDPFEPDEIRTGQFELAREAGVVDDLLGAAGGPFAIAFDTNAYGLVAADGSFAIRDGDPLDLDVPVMVDVEFDEYLFDDLTIRELGDGAFAGTIDPSARIALGVREVDGVDFLVADDASGVDRSVDQIRTILWLTVPLLTLTVAAIAWLLTSRSLRPVKSITEQAATISSGTLGTRVPVPATGDEIATLATTVNGMLDRLEDDDHRRRRFVSDASHELRSPVAVMRSEAEVALRHPDSTDVSQLASAVAAESTRLAAVIDDLLALARHDERIVGATTEVDLDDVVLTDARRTRRVPIDVAAVSAGRVRGRADELGRLVGHLLDNAARHAAERVAVGLSTAGDRVMLTVDDDGPGIPLEHRAAVFERFTRLDDARTRDQGGAGLGLAVVAGIAERQGGAVTVDDSPLGGARFTVTLPAA